MGGLVAELKRRHIYRIGAAYVVVARLLIQLYNNLTPLLRVPEWAGTLVLVLIVGGFPFALMFAWSLDVHAAAARKREAGAAAAAFQGKAQDKHARAARVSTSLPAPVAQPALPAPEPDGPSLVVLPFANLSDESGQDFFADGLTEDIITALSRFRHLFIISRNTAFQFKGKPAGARQVARELNVRYVLEGSVRKAGSASA